MGPPRVFTIPASAPFLPTLVRALVTGSLVPGFPRPADPLALATLYLPTRRACRLARDLFLDATGQEAAILPRIVALGDVDEDEFSFAEPGSAATLDLPPPLGALERRLLLMQLVMKWAAGIAPPPGPELPDSRTTAAEAVLVAGNPAAALALADELARLMDDMSTREASWEGLDRLVPEDFDHYWQLTLEFLKIARAAWPGILAERAAIDPAARRDALIKAEAARLAAGSDGPVIAAGSTGSMPATAQLIASIARLPQGAVVLPGLDVGLDAKAWELIGAAADGREVGGPGISHPQFAMHALLRRIGVRREQVVTLGEAARHGREVLASEALRPAAASDHWQRLIDSKLAGRLELAVESLSIIEAANAGEEALAIAIALREAMETPGKTAALVTPDRALARRVLAALERRRRAGARHQCAGEGGFARSPTAGRDRRPGARPRAPARTACQAAHRRRFGSALVRSARRTQGLGARCRR
jgi:ATP-dependent helicase/nuclease subunit B